MPQENRNRIRLADVRKLARRRKPAAAALLAVLLAGLLLTACGGGSTSASSTASTNASSTSPNGQRGQFAARGAALRTCLKKNGVTLPERKAPQQGGEGRRGPFGPGSMGGLRLPKGVTRAQLLEALKKCGGGFAGARRFNGAANTQRLTKFAACMRQNGVNLPAPNTSGKGPVFNTSGIDTTSEAFKKADAKCMRDLYPPAGAAGGGAGVGPPGGEPPA